MSTPSADLSNEAAPLRVYLVDSHAVVERGGALQCAALARTLGRRGHRVTCFFDGAPDQRPRGRAFQSLLDAGVDLRFAHLASPASIWRFRQLLRHQPPQILHTHKNRALRFVYLASMGLRRPRWVANRGTVYSLWRDPIGAAIHLGCVDRVLAVSGAVRDVLVAAGMPRERVEVVYGSMDPERFDPSLSGHSMRERWGIRPGEPLVGMLASLATSKKGHPDLLAAGVILCRRFPTLKIVIAGEGDARPLEAKARELGISDRVVFPGFVEEVPEALAAFDVLACPSLRGEGLTGAVREALAMQRPVVSTDCAGNAELVIDGETGALVPPADPERLANAIAGILEDPARAAAMAQAGRKRVLEHCTDEIRAERVEQIYRALLA